MWQEGYSIPAVGEDHGGNVRVPIGEYDLVVTDDFFGQRRRADDDVECVVPMRIL